MFKYPKGLRSQININSHSCATSSDSWKTLILGENNHSMANSNTGLPGFTALTQSVSLYKPPSTPHPPSSSRTSPDRGPSLIILSSWFKALPKHVSKFTSTYQNLYPKATILVLWTSTPDVVYRSYATQQTNLRPALPIIDECIRPQEAETENQPKGEILLQVFSNSGAHTACQLAHLYKSQTSSPLPIGALLIDSAPANSSFKGITSGFIAGLPTSPFYKPFATLLVYYLVGSITIKEKLTGETHWIDQMRGDLNDRELFEVGERGRCYFYGRGDGIVDWRDVERHVEEARRFGGRVRTEVGSGGHVGHMNADRERYWRAVREVWDGKDGGMVKSKL